MPPTNPLSLPKASLMVVDGAGVPPVLRFRFNPTEYSISKSSRWNRAPAPAAESSTPPEYSGTDPTILRMELFFDAFEEAAGDVSGDVETLLTWARPTPVSMTRSQAQPPLLRFVWGSASTLRDFQGYLKSVDARFTLFRRDGTPIRATASITLEEVTPEAEGQNPTSGAREGRRAHILAEGESLQSIAYREFGNAAMWRGLAEFNGVDDPLRLAPGRELLIPTPVEVRRLSEVSR